MFNRRVVWFSCGAASAVAAKLAIEKYRGCKVVYCDTSATEHPDNNRFFNDVQRWIKRKIIRLRSKRYPTINDVFRIRKYMSGPSGAVCTTELKKLVREDWQRIDDIHIFGYTSDEIHRAEQFEARNPNLAIEWILIDNDVSKEDCLTRLRKARIVQPKMYDLGFEHNNCLGCVKSASPGYWNRTRRLFPQVFQLRCDQSRVIGTRLVVLNGERIFLDELPEDAESPDDDIDCGPVCNSPLVPSE